MELINATNTPICIALEIEVLSVNEKIEYAELRTGAEYWY